MACYTSQQHTVIAAIGGSLISWNTVNWETKRRTLQPATSLLYVAVTVEIDEPNLSFLILAALQLTKI